MNFAERVEEIKSGKVTSGPVKMLPINMGTLIEGKISEEDGLKILCLQALAAEIENSCSGGLFANIPEEKFQRMMKVEEIIVEIIRKAIPSEKERQNVCYLVDKKHNVRYMPTRKYC